MMTPQRIIRSYFVIAGLYTLSASLIWGVNTLLLLDPELDIFGVFIANAVFTAGMVIFLSRPSSLTLLRLPLIAFWDYTAPHYR